MRRTILPPCQYERVETNFWEANAVVGVCKGRVDPRTIERSADDLEHSTGALVVQDGSTLMTLQIRGESLAKDQAEQMATILACYGELDHIIYPASKKIERELLRVSSGRGMKSTSSWNMLGLVGQSKTIITKEARTTSVTSTDVVDTEVVRVQKSRNLEALSVYSAVQVHDEIRSHLEFSWEDERGRLIYDLEQEVDSMRVMEYCVQRDKHRVSKGRKLRWAGVPSQLASDMWGMSKLPLGERARAVRTIWDKRWDGENQCKAGCSTPDICSNCGTRSGQRHMVEECWHPSIVRIREEAKKDMVKARGQLPVGGKEVKILSILEEMMKGVEAYSIWTGMWTVGVRKRYADKKGHEYRLDSKEYKNVVKVLSILADAVDKMLYVEQATVEAEVTEVASRTKKKRSIGGQRTLEELGCGPKRRHVDVEVIGSQIREAEATAPDARMPRHRVRSIREDDSSQFDVG
jgi:hypothetical protein